MSTAKLIFVVMLLTTIEVASFGLINLLLTRSGIETNPGPTIGNTLEWFEKIQKEGKVSEEKLKAEAQIFFKTDFKEDKKLVKKKVLELVKKRNNLLLQVQRKLQKYLVDKGIILKKLQWTLDFRSLMRGKEILNL